MNIMNLFKPRHPEKRYYSCTDRRLNIDTSRELTDEEQEWLGEILTDKRTVKGPISISFF